MTDIAREPITILERDVENEVLGILEASGAMEKHYQIGPEISAFTNIGGFFLIKNGKEIMVKLKEGYTYETISAWILGFCLSMALLQRKILTIHCSAISTEKGAVLISGTPGAGKSSLAGKLLEHGFKLMADDVAGIIFNNNECMVQPAFPYQKLCSNEIEKRGLNKKNFAYINEDKDKYLVPVNEIFEYNPQKLQAFFYIIKTPAEELSVKKLTGFNCFIAVKENLFLHKLHGSWESAPEIINLCMKIAASCPIYLISRPENADTLDEIYKNVINLLS